MTENDFNDCLPFFEDDNGRRARAYISGVGSPWYLCRKGGMMST